MQNPLCYYQNGIGIVLSLEDEKDGYQVIMPSKPMAVKNLFYEVYDENNRSYSNGKHGTFTRNR